VITTIPIKEGTISFRGQKVWYRSAGAREALGRLPLLCLHGGPGLPHDYLEPLEAVAAAGRRVIFYDQLGCGNSDHPYDPSLWTIPLFLDELVAMRKALGLVQVHLFGHFWGGMLAMEYALTRPEGLAGLILADAPASMRQFVEGTNRLRAELPAEVQCTLAEHEVAGTTEDPAYWDARMEFYHRHLCRRRPWPGSLTQSFDKWRRDPQVYLTMSGPSEFLVTGVLRDWDIVDRLGEIRAPTLLLSGRYDEVTPDVMETVHRGIRRSEWVLFENSANMAHLEEPQRYMEVLEQFLSRVERQL
jgi:proline-specific peptidase